MHAALTRHFVQFALFLLALLVLGSGCEKFRELTGQKGGTEETSAEKGSGDKATSAEKGSGDKGGSAKGGYFVDATAIPTKFAEKRGGSMFLELVIYPEYVKAQMQDPAKHENVDAFELRKGKVSEEGPAKSAGDTPTAKDLDEACIDGKTVDFALVPTMVKDAIAQTKIDDGKVTHVIFKRWRPFSNDPRWRVYVTGPRKDGSVEYDAKGKMIKVY